MKISKQLAKDIRDNKALGISIKKRFRELKKSYIKMDASIDSFRQGRTKPYKIPRKLYKCLQAHKEEYKDLVAEMQVYKIRKQEHEMALYSFREASY